MQHTAPHCITLQHTATHCITLQHTATHCNTLTGSWLLCQGRRCSVPYMLAGGVRCVSRCTLNFYTTKYLTLQQQNFYTPKHCNDGNSNLQHIAKIDFSPCNILQPQIFQIETPCKNTLFTCNTLQQHNFHITPCCSNRIFALQHTVTT